ncbi:MAG: hypothetical protein MI741_07630 [Rhodospirillales bacterium]|nr:hypothetical protein [Rhodospirillales bacterium]
MKMTMMPPPWEIVLTGRRQRGFADTLEQRARRIIGKVSNAADEWDGLPREPGALREPGAPGAPGEPGATLEREVALTVGQLDRTREFHREMMGRLLQMEVYVDTELAIVEGSTIGYADSNPQKGQNLRDKLMRLEIERQRQMFIYEDKLQKLHERLMGQVNRLTTLNP